MHIDHRLNWDIAKLGEERYEYYKRLSILLNVVGTSKVKEN